MKLIEEQQRVAKYFRSFKTAQDDSTPLALAQEMVSKIPEEVIKNKDSRFLDPCAGTGTFLIALFDRLSKYHGAGHIMSNMLYGFDNTITSKTLLIKLGFKNIERLDFLNTELDMKFDVVIGNPPYSKVKNERVRLWSKFIDNGLEVLTETGKLVFVTPSSWLSSTNYSHGILKDRLSYVNISEDVSKYFGKVGGTQRFIYFVAEKHESGSCVTEFDNKVKQEFPIMETPFSPVKSSSIHMHSIIRKLYHSDFPIFEWKRVDKVDESPSVIVPRARSINHKVEFEKVDPFGDTTRFKLYVDQELGEVLANNLNLRIYKQLRWDIRSGAGIANNFKQVPIPSSLMTDEELYSMLNLTEEEVEYANSLK